MWLKIIYGIGQRYNAYIRDDKIASIEQNAYSGDDFPEMEYTFDITMENGGLFPEVIYIEPAPWYHLNHNNNK